MNAPPNTFMQRGGLPALPGAFAPSGAYSNVSPAYLAEMEKARRKERLAQLLISSGNQQTTSPFGALARALSGYVGGRALKSADTEFTNAMTAQSQAEQQKYAALAKEFGLPDIGGPYDAQSVTLANALADARYKREHPKPFNVSPGAALVGPGGEELYTNKNMPRGSNPWRSTGIPGERINDLTGEVNRTSSYRTPEQKAEIDAEKQAKVQNTAQDARARSELWRTQSAQAQSGQAFLAQMTSVYDVIQRAADAGIHPDDLFGPIQGNDLYRQGSAVFDSRAEGFRQELDGRFRRMTLEVGKMLMKGQGSVTDWERRGMEALGGQVGNLDAMTALSKMSMMGADAMQAVETVNALEEFAGAAGKEPLDKIDEFISSGYVYDPQPYLDASRAKNQQFLKGASQRSKQKGETPPTITTQAQYDALPAGSVYILDGRKRVKK